MNFLGSKKQLVYLLSKSYDKYLVNLKDYFLFIAVNRKTIPLQNFIKRRLNLFSKKHRHECHFLQL